MINRRSLLTGFAGLVMAPAVIRVATLMPIKPFTAPTGPDYVWVEEAASRYLGMARLKPEGAAVLFDSYRARSVAMYPVAEPIIKGSMVSIGPDGLARNFSGHSLLSDIVGVAASNSGGRYG